LLEVEEERGQETPAGVALIFRGGLSSEADPAGVGATKMCAVIDEESDSLIKLDDAYGRIYIRMSCL